MNIGDWLAKALGLVLVLAVLTVIMAVVPFLFHRDLPEALLSGAGTAVFCVVGMLYQEWRGRRKKRRDPPPE
ncbi:hypothetical protein ACWEPC_02410 [Nonomuraea sp. NPDC004297]